MNINTLHKNPRMMRALTGMSQGEFNELVPDFERELRHHALNRHNRQRKPGGGQKGHLKTVEDKLFFTLFSPKTPPPFDVIAFFSDKSRGRSGEAVHIYLAILERPR